jgi:ABC-2 type transport system permease protein
MSLLKATRSEVTKQFSTSMWWVLAIVLVLYVAPTVAALGFVMVGVAEGILPGEASGMQGVPANLPELFYSFASSLGYAFALLVGTLMVTSEFRHSTLTPTFLATPKRGTALVAKLVVGVYIGLIYALIALASSVGPAVGVFIGFGYPTGLDDPEILQMLGRIVLSLVLWTLMGIGVGALLRNQVAAVVSVIVFTMFLEPVMRMAAGLMEGLDQVAAFLPGAASDALVGASFYELASAPGGFTLEWWAGGCVLAGYTLVFVVLGYLFSWRRDVS